MVVYKFWHGSGSLIFVFGKITAFYRASRE